MPELSSCYASQKAAISKTNNKSSTMGDTCKHLLSGSRWMWGDVGGFGPQVPETQDHNRKGGAELPVPKTQSISLVYKISQLTRGASWSTK